MARIMVSVVYQPTGEEKDFEVPDRIYASDFGQKVAEAFEGKIMADPARFWFQVGAISLDRYLRADETLREAGIWDGERLLVLKHLRKDASRQAAPQAQEPALESPTSRWKKLDIEVHKEERRARSGRTFIWKRA